MNTHYWERRYRAGGNSGEGSQGEAASFKADYINQWLKRDDIRSVVDWGCGDGQMCVLFDVDSVNYLGIEASMSALKQCRSAQPKPMYLFWGAEDPLLVSADMAMSIDVIFHLTDDSDYDVYMRNLFRSARRYVLIHSTNKDVQSNPQGSHILHRKIPENVGELYGVTGWDLIEVAPGVNGCEFMIYQRSDYGPE